MGDVDYLAQLMSGILPQPKAKSDVPMLLARPENVVSAPVAPVPVQPTVLGRMMSGANDMAGGIGRAMTPDVIRAMATIGKLGTDIGGRGLPANAISTLASNMAQGPLVNKQLGATPVAPTKVAQAPTSSGASDPRDLNKDGVVSPDELKISMTGTGSGAVSQLKNLFQSTVNPQSGAGDNVGTSAPVDTPVPTSVENFNEGYDKNAMWLSALSGTPGFVADLTKARMVNDVNTQKAVADQMSAQASLENARTAAVKLGWEQSDKYIVHQTKLEYFKKLGDKAAEEIYRKGIIADASKTLVTDPELKRYGSNLGQVMTALGTTDLSTIVNSIRAADARIEAAKIMASGGIKSAAIQSAGVERAAITGLLTNNEAELRRIGDVQLPLPKESPNYAMQQLLAMQGKIRFGAPEDVKRKEELVTEGNIYRQRLADLGGVDSTPSPRRERNTAPEATTFKTRDEVQAAVNSGKLKDGDQVTVGTDTFTIRIKGK